ncbi:sugar phosphate isomerase/epimerase family protein [Pseudonocardia dioxanivorans]|uniref:sugar phosphate isomerase/epimerase family protein n=1 Tax=Pseudonocardia dioxanivorans TaxID=240495 RepID=UPI0014051905|nr:sugar phosphate isomerase/epimerase family protein [Pseudonocardia dioxanivorans]
MSLPEPRYAVNSYSTPHNTVFEDIEQVARTGGQGVGLWEGKFADGGPAVDERVAAELAAHGLGTSIAVPALHAILSIPFDRPGVPTDPQERADRICASIERLARFSPQVVAVAPGTSGVAGEPVGPLEDVLRVLPQIADTAAACGVQIGLELLAERRGATISTLPDMVAVLDEVGRPNVGIMVDVFHSWCEPDLHARLRRYADRINSVQVCDVKPQERGGFDREYPGRGRGAAVEFVATMIEVGYTGYWELEVFSDDGTYGDAYPDSYWIQPHERFLAEAKAAFDDTWARATALVEARREGAVTA